MLLDRFLLQSQHATLGLLTIDFGTWKGRFVHYCEEVVAENKGKNAYNIYKQYV